MLPAVRSVFDVNKKNIVNEAYIHLGVSKQSLSLFFIGLDKSRNIFSH